MRDIEFRGIVKEKGMSECWIKGSLLHITKTYKGEEDEQECDIYQIITDDGAGFFVDKETVGQYTEIKDKNGKEIYEGDIVQARYFENSTSEKYVVKYDNNRAGFFPFACGDGCGCCETDVIDARYAEVLGNIYDNPELLGGMIEE